LQGIKGLPSIEITYTNILALRPPFWSYLPIPNVGITLQYNCQLWLTVPTHQNFYRATLEPETWASFQGKIIIPT